MGQTETKPNLPRALILNDVPLAAALTALADRLSEIASTMTRVGDLTCEIDINGDRASLIFRATK